MGGGGYLNHKRLLCPSSRTGQENVSMGSPTSIEQWIVVNLLSTDQCGRSLQVIVGQP